MQEVFEKIINFIHSEIERTTSWAEHDTLINVEFFVEELAEKYNNGWISCGERLPNEYGEYLYTDINDEVHEGCFAPYDGVLIGGWSTCHADGVVSLPDNEVIAWQPLPAPYKKEV